MKKGRAGTMTHDYKRHGTTTLFAALNVLDGTVIGRCMQRHRHEEFIRFLNAIERTVPAGELIHAIADNYATHKHPKVRAWLARHPRWTFHFTPTSCSWLNAVENFFATLTKRRLKRGVFCSIVDLQAAINRYLAEHNHKPEPFVWKADPKRVLAAIERGKQALEFDPLVALARAGRIPELVSIPNEGLARFYEQTRSISSTPKPSPRGNPTLGPNRARSTSSPSGTTRSVSTRDDPQGNGSVWYGQTIRGSDPPT